MKNKQTSIKKSKRKQKMPFYGKNVRAGHEDAFLINMSDVRSGHLIILQLSQEIVDEMDYIAKYNRTTRTDWLKGIFLDAVRHAKQRIYDLAERDFAVNLITADEYEQIKKEKIPKKKLQKKNAARQATKRMLQEIRQQARKKQPMMKKKK
ncbi:MAG: hypothetical protein ABIJ21_00035 [Nanoarchaeota archaeon]